MTSTTLEDARKKANLAFDEHCAQWEALQQIPSPTPQDLDKWILAREAAQSAQKYFEGLVHQIHGV